MFSLLLVVLAGCDQTLDRHWGPVWATLRVRKEYHTTGGRLGIIADNYELVVDGYPPLPVDTCQDAEVTSRSDPQMVLWRCGTGPWRPVYLGERHLLGGCPLAEGEEPADLTRALPTLFRCHVRTDEVLHEAGEGKTALLLATSDVALALDTRGDDAWLSAAAALPPDQRSSIEGALRHPDTAAEAWRAIRLGVEPSRDATAALVAALVVAPREPLRDLVLPALLLMTPELPDRVALACRAVPESALGYDVGRDNLRAALALALGEEVGQCAALRLREDACLTALSCDVAICSPEQLEQRLAEARARPVWELVRQPGLTAEDVIAAQGAIPASSRLRTSRIFYAQDPASPACSAAQPGEPCACLESEVLLSRTVCEAPGSTVRVVGCEARIDDDARSIAGRKLP